MTLRRTATSLLLVIGALAFSAAPASAHTELKSSNPAAGAVLDEAPKQLELTFTEPVTLPADAVQVVSDTGSWTIGTPSVAGAVVTVPVTPSGPAGPHTIKWKVVSEDGDPVSGSIIFALSKPVAAPTSSSAPAPTTTTTEASGTASNTPAPAAQDSDSGLPVWVWVVIGLVVVAAAGGGFLVARRR
ncbi:copper resistance protein CopC [Lentzea tibetensis]|uniref:Copper resistance protein CopC n=1 Tax=Lentzea tibetensis TaxID=2591470 RepID=A0A563EY93_9PSEU|nr:copper resistance CopC family protein [Lentzea tibetensis]TWP52690.1 copper resistance protein CopC [Lentzea tibetensis]